MPKRCARVQKLHYESNSTGSTRHDFKREKMLDNFSKLSSIFSGLNENWKFSKLFM
jgi:hypothetical protein